MKKRFSFLFISGVALSLAIIAGTHASAAVDQKRGSGMHVSATGRMVQLFCEYTQTGR